MRKCTGRRIFSLLFLSLNNEWLNTCELDWHCFSPEKSPRVQEVLQLLPLIITTAMQRQQLAVGEYISPHAAYDQRSASEEYLSPLLMTNGQPHGVSGPTLLMTIARSRRSASGSISPCTYSRCSLAIM